MSGSQWTALQAPASTAPAWEMLRVLSSDPSPQHENADTWLREDTRGWGRAPLNPGLPERSELSKGGSQPEKVNGFTEACGGRTTPREGERDRARRLRLRSSALGKSERARGSRLPPDPNLGPPHPPAPTG